MYIKCKDDFLLGLLVCHATPLLYSGDAKSQAELFLGQKLATNIPYIPFGTTALMQHPGRHDQDHGECRFDPQDGNFCYARLNPMENTWEKGFIVRKITGVPDSYIVKVDGQRYHRNKCDITLHKPGETGDIDSHFDSNDEPMAAGVMPTLIQDLNLSSHVYQFKQLNNKPLKSSFKIANLSGNNKFQNLCTGTWTKT